MSHDKLVRMANQIATFFETSADADPAMAVAGHINDFWEPRMRTQLLEIIANGDDGLKQIVLAAGPNIRQPKAATLT